MRDSQFLASLKDIMVVFSSVGVSDSNLINLGIPVLQKTALKS